MKTLVARTPAAWRRWLATHHDSTSEIWLVFFKRHTGETSLAYSDAVDEALCFGWIDGLVRRLDDARYARRFTPRRANSLWSATNLRRYAALKKAGRLTPAGIARAPNGRTYPPRPAIRRERTTGLK
jgi:uncharacterized protein YdeI (YjbR/CyaY-like superfamily)